MKKGYMVTLLLLMAVIFTLTADAARAQQSSKDIYVIGVMQPLNKTELPGHIDFPYYAEVMKMELESSPNNFIVKVIDRDNLEEAGYSFSSIKNDVDLQPDTIKKICYNERLDALLTGRITKYSREMVPRLFDPSGRKIVFEMEGVLYSRDGREVWSKTVSTDEEFKRDHDQFVPPQWTQMVNTFVDDTKKLASDLVDRIGQRPLDREAPMIQFENVKSGDKVATTCIILKGKVSDNSRVDSITVNGQELPLLKPEKEVEMFHPVQIPMGAKGQEVLLTVTATDIYGIKQTKQFNLEWVTPIKGIVTQVNKDTLSVGFSYNDFNRVTNGMGFQVYSVDEFIDPLSSHRMRMFTVENIGPVVVVEKFPNKSVVHVKFLKTHEDLLNRVKKDDIVK